MAPLIKMTVGDLSDRPRITKLVVDAGETDADFLHEDGLNLPMVKASVETRCDEDDEPISSDMTITASSGASHFVHADVVKRAALPFGEKESLSLMHGGLARYSMDGSVGYGVTEYLIRTKWWRARWDSDPRPTAFVPIG
jgi:hypothetical protein